MTTIPTGSRSMSELSTPGRTDPVVGLEHDLPEEAREIVFEVRNLAVHYSGALALRDITVDIAANEITAVIGPSGCGKSTFIRCLNRMNDLVVGAKVEGLVRFRGEDLYDSRVDPASVRRRIGMVFQRPNPFPKSIYENVAYGPRINKMKEHLDDTVERALTQAALWDEVKDKLKKSGLALSGGQQQRLCIARALAVQPDVLLMDDLKRDYTIVIVTHNMQQAARVSDRTAFLTTEVDESGHRSGRLVEFARTSTLFTHPSDPRTE